MTKDLLIDKETGKEYELKDSGKIDCVDIVLISTLIFVYYNKEYIREKIEFISSIISYFS